MSHIWQCVNDIWPHSPRSWNSKFWYFAVLSSRQWLDELRSWTGRFQQCLSVTTHPASFQTKTRDSVGSFSEQRNTLFASADFHFVAYQGLTMTQVKLHFWKLQFPQKNYCSFGRRQQKVEGNYASIPPAYHVQMHVCVKIMFSGFVDHHSDWSLVSLLSITAERGVTYSRAIPGLECVKHYEDVIAQSVQGTPEIFSDI